MILKTWVKDPENPHLGIRTNQLIYRIRVSVFRIALASSGVALFSSEPP